MKPYVGKRVSTELWNYVEKRKKATGEKGVEASRSLAKILSQLETDIGLDVTCPLIPKINTKKRVMVWK